MPSKKKMDALIMRITLEVRLHMASSSNSLVRRFRRCPDLDRVHATERRKGAR
jgi:hypothetical protein